MLRRAAGYLGERGCDTARLDAELMLADVLGVERMALYTDHERPMSGDETDRYRASVARRAKREPVAYILGRRGFRRLELGVTSDVLVPRPETELLVEWAMECAPEGATVLDWGTGSGAIALALADERPDLQITAVDRSEPALAVARSNDTAGAVEWLASDGFTGLPGRRFHVVVANPPYLADAEMAEVAPELAFEPRGALVAGPSGLEAIAAIVAQASDHLTDSGWLLVEIGAGQATAAADLLREAGYREVAVRRDLAGIERMVGGHR